MSVLQVQQPLPAPTPENLIDLVNSWLPQYLTYLEEIVNISSSSRDEEGLRECATVISRIIEEVLDIKPEVTWIKGRDGIERGFFDVRLVPQNETPTSQEEIQNNGYVVHLAHYDTVLDRTDEFSFSNDGEVLRGPGVFDDKGSVLASLFALRLLQIYAPDEVKRWIKTLITADEEITSLDGRKVISSHMPSAFAVLGLEGMDSNESGEGVALRVGRKGFVTYVISYSQDELSPVPIEPAMPHATRYVFHYAGVAAHAGTEMHRGADANYQALIDVNAISALHDPAQGIRVTYESLDGGTTMNKVSDEAQVTFTIESDSAEKLELARHVIDETKMVISNVKRTIQHDDLDAIDKSGSSERRSISNAILQAAIDGEWLKVVQNLDTGISMNVGRLRSKPSSGPLMEIEMEGRAFSSRHLQLIVSTVQGLPLQMPGLTKISNGGIGRDAWARDVGSERVFEMVRRVHEMFGFSPVYSKTSPGVTDTNLVPSHVQKVDGLGIWGDGDHGKNERAFVKDVVPAVIRIAVTSSELLGDPLVKQRP